MNEFYRHEQSDKKKWIITGVAFFIMAIFIALLCMQAFGNGRVKPSEWFTRGETEQETPPPIEDGGLITGNVGDAMVIAPTVSTGAGVSFKTARLSQMLSETEIAEYAEENGISVQSANKVQRLTATVTPADAVNKVLDWGQAFQNASSAWASGKTVTDYVEVVPTSDGALTADVICKQAFAEKIVIVASVRDADFIKGECTVDYERKLVGFDLSVIVKDAETWTLTVNNLNPTVDYLKQAVSIEYVGYMYDVSSYTTWSYTPRFSSSYTVDNTQAQLQGIISGVKFYVCATSAYLNCFDGYGGLKVSAEEYVEFTPYGSNKTTMAALLYTKYLSSVGSIDWTTLRTRLYNARQSEMLRIKIVARQTYEEGEAPIETVYNLKFSQSSLNSRVAAVTLPTGVTF